MTGPPTAISRTAVAVLAAVQFVVVVDETTVSILAHGGRTGEQRPRGVAGISMSGNSVLRIAENHPGLYRAVGSYSGCAETATPVGQAFVRTVTSVPWGADASNLAGPPWDRRWADQDPILNAHKLAIRTPVLWISVGNGLTGRNDRLDDPKVAGDAVQLAQQVVLGGLNEAAAQYCTVNLARRLAELRIPATVRFNPNGTHSWGYWEDELHLSWPSFAAALGV